MEPQMKHRKRMNIVYHHMQEMIISTDQTLISMTIHIKSLIMMNIMKIKDIIVMTTVTFQGQDCHCFAITKEEISMTCTGTTFLQLAHPIHVEAMVIIMLILPFMEGTIVIDLTNVTDQIGAHTILTKDLNITGAKQIRQIVDLPPKIGKGTFREETQREVINILISDWM